MDTAQFQPIVSFIWSVADSLLRDRYKKKDYSNVILPMVVIRRLDAVLEPTKEEVLQAYAEYKDKIENLDSILKNISKMSFYNTSKFTLSSLCDDPKNIRINFENYLDSFSPNIQDIIAKFEFKQRLDRLEEANILFSVIEHFCSPKVNFSIHPIRDSKGQILYQGLSNLGMGYVFEELIRRFNEENNEEAGEHFTPREIIKLMNHLVFLPIKDAIKEGIYLIYDNACGSGGMLTESKSFLTDPNDLIRSEAKIYLYGQEINPETYALCKADMLIKGEEADYIKHGSTLSNDELGNLKFDFMLTNPPYGKDWSEDQKQIGVQKSGKTTCQDPRFQIGITSKSDGQMMFLLNMLSKMKDPREKPYLGSRIASVHNGSSLFNSDSGQVAIRKHIIQNDLLEAIIALPMNMFYNTGIPTFIWIITNNKSDRKKGKVQLINATSEKYYSKMKKSLGKKQNEMKDEHIKRITDLFLHCEDEAYKFATEGTDCLVLDNDEFGYTKITIEKPKSAQELLEDEKFLKLPKKDQILEKLKALESNPQDFKDRSDFIAYLDVKLSKSEAKILIHSDKTTHTEKIPLKIPIQSYYDKEIKPFVPNSWIDWESQSVGYEILFNKYFYTYTPPRALESIKEDLQTLEAEVQNLLSEILE